MVTELTSLDPNRLAPEPSDPMIAEVMRDEVVFCLPSTPLDAVAKLMTDNDLEEVVVLIDRKPIGYVHQQDILALVAAGQLPLTGTDFAVRPPQTTVQALDVMRKPPLLVDEKQITSEVVDLMRQGDRTVAFVTHEDEFPVGMVTAREIAKWMASR